MISELFTGQVIYSLLGDINYKINTGTVHVNVMYVCMYVMYVWMDVM